MPKHLKGRKEPNPYTAAKQILLNQYNDSEDKRLNKLFDDTPVANQSQSELLDLIRRRAGSSVSDKAIRQLWWSKIKGEIKPYLTACSEMPLKQLAEHADTVKSLLDKASASPTIAATSTQEQVRQNIVSNTDQSALIVSALQSLQKEIAALRATGYRSPSPRRSRRGRSVSSDRSPSPHYRKHQNEHRYRNRSNSRKRVEYYDDECWYHYTFGSRATRCKPKCKHYKEKTEN